MKIRISRVIITLIVLAIMLFGIVYVIDQVINKEPEIKDDNNQDDSKDDEIKEPEPVVIPFLEKTSYLNEITNNENLNSEIEEEIVSFLDSYYKAMGTLETVEMSDYFVSLNDSYLIYQTVIDLLVELRGMKHVDLSLYDAYYDLEVKSVKQSGSTVTVEVYENSFINFTFMKEITTEVYNVSNMFTFELVDGEYKIKSYSKGQDFYVLITDKYNGGGITELNKLKTDYLNQTEDLIKELEVDLDYLNENGIDDTKSCTYEYNREDAYYYANEWVGARSDDWWTFDFNCQNYASQVLMAGGIPMDYTGDANKQLQLKFYDGSYNLNEEAKGYNYTWTYVPYFYTYAKDNTGPGLCATVDENIYFAEAGDVIQLGTKWYDRHTVVSMGPYVVNDEVQDILLNSNSVDLRNFPLSAYTYPYARLIKVRGYN